MIGHSNYKVEGKDSNPILKKHFEQNEEIKKTL